MKLIKIIKPPMIYLAILAAKLKKWEFATRIMERYLSGKDSVKAADYYRLAFYAFKAGCSNVAMEGIKQALLIAPENKRYICLLANLVKPILRGINTKEQKKSFITSLALPTVSERQLKKNLPQINGVLITQKVPNPNGHTATIKIKQSKKTIFFNVKATFPSVVKPDDVARVVINFREVAQFLNWSNGNGHFNERQ